MKKIKRGHQTLTTKRNSSQCSSISENVNSNNVFLRKKKEEIVKFRNNTHVLKISSAFNVYRLKFIFNYITYSHMLP